MRLEDYFDFLGPDVIRIKGHRIGIEHVLEYYRDGYSPEQIAAEFPGLSLKEIHAAITYCLHYQPEVDAYLARLDRWSEEQYQESKNNPSPVIQRLRQLKAERRQYPEEGSASLHAFRTANAIRVPRGTRLPAGGSWLRTLPGAIERK
jgi:uncharacterized protein (DUF433 family)